MKILVAGVDRSADLGSEVVGAAKAMVAAKTAGELPPSMAPGASVLTLGCSRNEGEYLDRLTTLMLGRAGIGTYDFYVPRTRGLPGSVAAVLKRLLWKLLRYQHDRVAFQQNAINTQLTAAVEFMQAEYELRIDALAKRVAELEKKGN